MTPEEKKQENPAAFPFKSIDFEASAEAKTTIYDGYSEGMTLRDYFAAKAMQGMIIDEGCAYKLTANLAEEAYTIADAMLKARQL